MSVQIGRGHRRLLAAVARGDAQECTARRAALAPMQELGLVVEAPARRPVPWELTDAGVRAAAAEIAADEAEAAVVSEDPHYRHVQDLVAGMAAGERGVLP